MFIARAEFANVADKIACTPVDRGGAPLASLRSLSQPNRAATALQRSPVEPHVVFYLKGERREDENPFAEHMLFCEQGIDNLEDLVDLFWEQPFAFATFVHHRYRG